MITFKELLTDHLLSDIPLEHLHNMEELLKRINVVRKAYGNPMVVTSCYRTKVEHIDIYARLGVSADKVPMRSMHLRGAAVDILDRDGELMKWVKSNEKLLAEVGLWVEDDSKQPRVHFQIFPPRSGARFFKP